MQINAKTRKEIDIGKNILYFTAQAVNYCATGTITHILVSMSSVCRYNNRIKHQQHLVCLRLISNYHKSVNLPVSRRVT